MRDIYLISNHIFENDGIYKIKIYLLIEPSVSDVYLLKIIDSKFTSNSSVYKEYRALKKQEYQTEEVEMVFEISIFLKRDNYQFTIETLEDSLFRCETVTFTCDICDNK